MFSSFQHLVFMAAFGPCAKQFERFFARDSDDMFRAPATCSVHLTKVVCFPRWTFLLANLILLNMFDQMLLFRQTFELPTETANLK